jgi:hypothetical protein
VYLIMAAPLFGPNWMEKTQKQHDTAVANFLAAVSTARTSSDEGIKQVRVSGSSLCISFEFFGCDFWSKFAFAAILGF